ncbi:MAG: NADH-quinone oxidoreductase subunit K [Sulfolobales archaeon]
MNIFMLVASILFMIAVYGIISSRNIARILLSVEIMFNSVVLYILSLLISMLRSPDIISEISILIIFAVGLAVSEIIVTFSILLALIRFKVVRKIDTREIIIRDLEGR